MNGQITEVKATKEIAYRTYVIRYKGDSYNFSVEEAIIAFINDVSSEQFRVALVETVLKAGYVASETLGQDGLPFVQVFHSKNKGNVAIHTYVPSRTREDGDGFVEDLQKGICRMTTPSKVQAEMNADDNGLRADFQSPARKKFLASSESPRTLPPKEEKSNDQGAVVLTSPVNQSPKKVEGGIQVASVLTRPLNPSPKEVKTGNQVASPVKLSPEMVKAVDQKPRPPNSRKKLIMDDVKAPCTVRVGINTSSKRPDDVRLKKKTKRVKFGNLPKKRFSTETLLEFINVEMRDHLVLLNDDDSPAIAVLQLNHEEHTCIIEFDSVDNAMECCSMPLNFWNSELHVEIIEKEECNDIPKMKSNKVKVSNLPPKKFSKDTLLEFINVEMRDHLVLLNDDDSPALAVLELDHDEHTCILEFDSVDNAMECCSMPLNFWNSELHVEIIEKEECNDIPKMKSNKVKVSNLPPKKFSKDTLLEFINVEMRDHLVLLNDDDSPALAVLELDHDEHTCILEFDSVDNAMECCSMPLNFWKSQLLVELIEEDFINLKPRKKSNKVEVYNLPTKTFSSESLLEYFSEEVRELLQIPEAEAPACRVLELRRDRRTCIIEFRDAEEARAACLIENPEFWKSPLSLFQLEVEDNVVDVFTSSPVCSNNYENLQFDCSGIQNEIPEQQDLHPCLSSSSSESDDNATSSIASVEAVIPHNVKWRGDWPTLETLILLKYCIKYKDLLRSTATRNVGRGRTKLWKSMLKANLYYRLTTIKNKLTVMKSTYSPDDAKWPFHKFYAEFVGDTPLGSSKIKEAIAHARVPSPEQAVQSRCTPASRKVGNSQYDFGVLVMENVLAQEHSNLFNEPKMTFLLITEYMFRKELFDDDKHRASELYRDVKNVFHQHGYTKVNEEHLSGRLNWLAMEFKGKYDAVRNKTGSSDKAQQWIFYSPMSSLLEGSYVIEPQKLLSMGSSNSLVVRNRKKTPQSTRPPSEIASVFKPGASYKSQKLACSMGIREDLANFSQLVNKKWFGEDSA